MLIKDKTTGQWRMTRLQAYKRYIHTLFPIEQLVALYDRDEEIRPLTPKEFIKQ